MNETIVDLVPFLRVSDVERSVSFYEALGFTVVKTHAPLGTLEFAGLQATSSAKVMLARVDAVPPRDPDEPGRGFLYLYTPDLDAFRKRLVGRGIDAGEIEEGAGPGPNRELCVRDPTATRTWSPNSGRVRSRAIPEFRMFGQPYRDYTAEARRRLWTRRRRGTMPRRPP